MRLTRSVKKQRALVKQLAYGPTYTGDCFRQQIMDEPYVRNRAIQAILETNMNNKILQLAIKELLLGIEKLIDYREKL
jgi:hypothetical protein